MNGARWNCKTKCQKECRLEVGLAQNKGRHVVEIFLIHLAKQTFRSDALIASVTEMHLEMKYLFGRLMFMFYFHKSII